MTGTIRAEGRHVRAVGGEVSGEPVAQNWAANAISLPQ